MSRVLRRRSLVTLAATVATVCGGLAACSSTPSSSSHGKTGATPTLVMESSPESTITQAFNPFVATQAAFGMGATGLIYEPLIQFNLAAPPKYYPWLATSHAWSNGGKTPTLPLPPGGEWEERPPPPPAPGGFTVNHIQATAAVNPNQLKNARCER